MPPPKSPFAKQLNERRHDIQTSTSSWINSCCTCCFASSHPQRSQYQGVAMTHMNGSNGITSASPSSSSSSVTSPSTSSNPSSPSSTGKQEQACCCGLRFIVVVRLIFCVLLVACIIVGVFFFHTLSHTFLETLEYIRQIGPLRGSVVLCIANIIGALLFMPCVPFTLGAGYLYGTLVGSAIVSVASTIAAVIAFLTARYLARAWIEKSLGGKSSKFRILDNAINQDGFRIVLWIRASPLHPYGVCNYLFGLTSVTGRDYTIASFFGMLPTTVMEVYFGTAIQSVADIISGNMNRSPMSRIFFYAGLLVSILVTVALTIHLRAKLRTEMDKYRAVSTADQDGGFMSEDDNDGFGSMLNMGSSSSNSHAHRHVEHAAVLEEHDNHSEPEHDDHPLTTTATSTRQHDDALDEKHDDEVVVQIDRTSNHSTPSHKLSNVSPPPKSKVIVGGQLERTNSDGVSVGLKSTRRPKGPTSSIGNNAIGVVSIKPALSKASLPKSLAPKLLISPISDGSITPNSSSSSLILPPLQSSSQLIDEEEALESESLIATKQV